MYIMVLFLTIIFLHFVVGNLLLAYDIIHRFTFQTVGNATFSVDSFFFLRWVVCHFSLCIKDYFQSVLHSLSTLMFINIVSLARWNANQCHLIQTTYLTFEAFQVLFSDSFIDFYSFKVVSLRPSP